MTMPNPDMLPGPVTAPSAWKGADMRKDDSWIYRLDEREIAEIESAFTKLAASVKRRDEIQQSDFRSRRSGGSSRPCAIRSKTAAG